MYDEKHPTQALASSMLVQDGLDKKMQPSLCFLLSGFFYTVRATTLTKNKESYEYNASRPIASVRFWI